MVWRRPTRPSVAAGREEGLREDSCSEVRIQLRSHPRGGPSEWLRKARKLRHLLAVSAYRRALLAHRVAATIEHEGQPFAESYGTVIDVGSNRGQFAVFARHRWPDARLLCFEPLSGPREVLARLANALGDTQVF